ncbi:DUF3800 domain-containing protein [Amaricoccus tamworthensis]|uniref:DUF3800 domain-containing protein n=1 Tax=Amaricoccus tamworthensis TaxID=57002 RepID=UPI003C7E6B77
MVNIYVDEAGTSPAEHESVTVVAAVIIPHNKWREVENFRQKVVSEYIQTDACARFIFHAKDITSGKKTPYTDWSVEKRWQFVKDMLSVIRASEITISIGAALAADDDLTLSRKDRATRRHLTAHDRALYAADAISDRIYPPSEIATVISEDTNKMRQTLRKLHWEMQRQRSSMTRKFGSVRRIVGAIHFAEKKYEPPLQFADAYAFAFRRFFSQHKYAEDLIQAMFTGTNLTDIEHLRDGTKGAIAIGMTDRSSDLYSRFLGNT